MITAAIASPNTAPRVSMARCNPKLLPLSSARPESAISASRGEVRTPFPTLSPNLIANTAPQLDAMYMKGLARVEMVYPNTARGLRLPILSLNQPLNILRIASAPSDSPPTRPTRVAPAPSTLHRKRGTSVKIISLLMSVSRLTIPRKNTLGFNPQILLSPRLVFNDPTTTFPGLVQLPIP